MADQREPRAGLAYPRARFLYRYTCVGVVGRSLESWRRQPTFQHVDHKSLGWVREWVTADHKSLGWVLVWMTVRHRLHLYERIRASAPCLILVSRGPQEFILVQMVILMIIQLMIDASRDSLADSLPPPESRCERRLARGHWIRDRRPPSPPAGCAATDIESNSPVFFSCSSLTLTLVPLYTVQLAAAVAQQFTHTRRVIRCTSADSASSRTQGSSESEVRVHADGASAEADAASASLNCHRKRPLSSPWRCPARRLLKSAPINPSTLVRLYEKSPVHTSTHHASEIVGNFLRDACASLFLYAAWKYETEFGIFIVFVYFNNYFRVYNFVYLLTINFIHVLIIYFQYMVYSCMIKYI